MKVTLMRRAALTRGQTRGVVRCLTLAVGLLGSLAAVGAAPETPLHKRITVKYNNLPVADVLKDLGDQAGLRFSFDEKLVATADNVTCEAADVEAGRVAMRILRPRGFQLGKTEGSQVAVERVSDLDEFRVKPEQVYAFAEKPKVTREGDKVTIAFETKGWCDVTIAIENAGGKIIRHLASGVLGDNAPEPFAWNSKKQTIVWDGKNDQGEYVDDTDNHTVRVSLGLKPQYEGRHYWEPKRRVSDPAPLMAAAEEGVYIFDGKGVDHLRLYDHNGDYVRTIYPFPADKMKDVKGLDCVKFPQLAEEIPLKRSGYRSTLLTSGDNGLHTSKDFGFGGVLGNAACAMAVRNGRIALVKYYLNRLATDGSTGGLALQGPRTSYLFNKATWAIDNIHLGQWSSAKDRVMEVPPTSAAFSPDGKWLYLTGYQFTSGPGHAMFAYYRHGVMRMRYDGDAEPQVFLGEMEKPGDDNAHFNTPTQVDCDEQGRVYVADYLNDRVQVFSPDGKYLKTVRAVKPALLRIHRKSQELYAGSWGIPIGGKNAAFEAGLTRLGAFDNPKVIARYGLPGVSTSFWSGYGGYYWGYGCHYTSEVDSWTAPFVFWMNPERTSQEARSGLDKLSVIAWDQAYTKLMAPEADRLIVKRDFAQDAMKTIDRLSPAKKHSQHLFVNPKTGHVYIGEYQQKDIAAISRTQEDLIDIDPETGKHRLIKLPARVTDVDFDPDGLAYLRVLDVVVRYDLDTRREVPWDYGEERNYYGWNIIAGLFCGHLSWGYSPGIGVSADGAIAIPATGADWGTAFRQGKEENVHAGMKNLDFKPLIYPGRPVAWQINIWDKHGKLLHRDAVPGTPWMSGLCLDRNHDLVVAVHADRVLNGKPYFLDTTVTLTKFRPGKGRHLSGYQGLPIPLPEGTRPKRPRDMASAPGDSLWVQGVQWMYGGVGFWHTCNGCPAGCTCGCWHSRTHMDYFGRVFAPEPDIFRVAVLDTNGNLILRVGQYGNEDSNGPNSLVPLGGDGVGLFSPNYVATHTDRRLFIADAGNARIVSVKLGYHAEEKVALKDVKDTKKPE